MKCNKGKQCSPSGRITLSNDKSGWGLGGCESALQKKVVDLEIIN